MIRILALEVFKKEHNQRTNTRLCGDIIRLAMIKIDKILEQKEYSSKMLLQIHDELIFECSKKDENKTKKIIKDAMTSVSSSEQHMFSIPLEVSINSGNNWGEAH